MEDKELIVNVEFNKNKYCSDIIKHCKRILKSIKKNKYSKIVVDTKGQGWVYYDYLKHKCKELCPRVEVIKR